MKKLLVATFIALLMTGRGGEAQSQPAITNKLFNAIDWDDEKNQNRIIAVAMDGSELQEREEKGESLFYLLEEQTPYTGWGRHEISDAIGGLTRLIRFKGGKNQGHVIFRKNDNKLRKVKVDNFKDGKMHGLSTEWRENGQKFLERNFKDGKQDGLWIQWHENGTESIRATYEDDKPVGLSRAWYENGRKKLEINYKEGKVATVVVWKPNGEKCRMTNVKSGNGVEAEYFEKGTEPNRFCWVFIYTDGKKISWRPRQVSWHENGQMRFVASFFGKKRDGRWIEWFKNGQMLFQGNFKLGKKDGPWTYWHENGRKRSEESFRNGLPHGLSKEWDDQGGKETESNWKEGKMDGLVTRWYKSGQKEWVANFKEGELQSVFVWKPKGEKCPVTNVVNGSGVWVLYEENGTEESSRYYLDGKKASLRLVFPPSASPYEDGRKSAHGPKQGEEDFLFENNFSVASPI